MSLSVPANVQTALDAGRAVRRQLVEIALGSGTYRFWDGVGPLTFEGHTWQPGAGLIVQTALERSTGGEVSSVELVLRSIPDSALTPDVLASIHSEQWYQRPVQLSTLYIDPDTRQTLGKVVKFTGRIDTIDDDVDPASGVAELKATCESYLRDLSRRVYGRASDKQQQAIFPGDRGFEHADFAGITNQPWGRNAKT